MKSFQLFIPKSLNLLIYAFPISLILGNFFINLLVFFFSILGIIYYKTDLFKFRKNIPLILIVIFFLLILFSTLIEILINNENGYLLKAVLFFRYLLFLLVLRCMILKNELNLEKTFLSFFIFATFVATDVIFQYFVGVDLFGKKSIEGLNSGPFGEEYIAGGYIQKFAVIGFFSIPWILNYKNFKIFYLVFLLLGVCFIGTLLSGNRMPTIMFVFFFFLLILVFLFKKFNLKVVGFIISILICFILIISLNEKIKARYLNFYYAGIPKISNIIEAINEEYPEFKKYEGTGVRAHNTEEFKKKYFETTEIYEEWARGIYGSESKDIIKVFPGYTGHTQLYITALDLFFEDPILGRGIKSFRYTCTEKVHLPNRICQNHPHNFYLEILNDVGIIGLILLLSSVFLLIIRNKGKGFVKGKKINPVISSAFVGLSMALIIELFPLRSHGSFFSVWNASYLFFIIGILCGIYELEPKKFRNKRFDF